MSKLLFDFLTESLLFNENHLENQFSKFSTETLEKEIKKYREYVLQQIPELISDIQEKQISITMEGVETSLPNEDILKQFSLYMDSVVINDPVFQMTPESSKLNKSMNALIASKDKNNEYNRKKLVQNITYMKKLTSGVAADFIKFFPLSYFHEPPKELPIEVPANFYEDALPPKLMELFKSKANVTSYENLGEGKLKKLSPHSPARYIGVEFEGKVSLRSQMYQLWDIDDYEDSTGHVRMVLPQKPPEEKRFADWVYQSINQCAKSNYEQIIKDISCAGVMGNTYFTRSTLTRDVLDILYQGNRSLHTDIGNLVLSLDLPSIQSSSFDRLMDIRRQDSEVFLNFRVELEKHLRELRLLENKEQLTLKLEHVAHEMEEVQVNEIRKKLNKIKRTSFGDFGIFIASLLASTYGMNALLSGIGLGWALNRANAIYGEYMSLKDSPAYFLWKLK